MKQKARGFMDFVREQGVVGLAVGLAIGTQATLLVRDIVTAVIDPLVGLIIGNPQGLAAASWTATIGGRQATFALGQLAYSFIVFISVCLVVYLLVKGLKLDKLDKQKG